MASNYSVELGNNTAGGKLRGGKPIWGHNLSIILKSVNQTVLEQFTPIFPGCIRLLHKMALGHLREIFLKQWSEKVGVTDVL